MNARRRTKPDGLPSRVYTRYGSYFWVRNTDEKWIKLCRVDDGETRMFERLAEEKHKTEIDGDEASMSRLVAIYMTSMKASTPSRTAPNGSAAARTCAKRSSATALRKSTRAWYRTSCSATGRTNCQPRMR